MHPERVYTSVIHAGEPGVIVGWLALALNGQVDGGFDCPGTFGENRGASVVARWGAGSKNHVLDAIQFDRGFGDGGELGRGLALDRPAGGEGLADGAELAGFGSALIADASLQHRGGQHVPPVQDSDFRIRDAVLGGQVVEAGALREADASEIDAIADNAAVAIAVGCLGDIGTFEGRRRMDRNHDRHPVDRDGLVIGRTRAAAAAFDAGFWISQPHAVGLQFVDQVFRRNLRVHPGYSHEESFASAGRGGRREVVSIVQAWRNGRRSPSCACAW